MPDQKETLAVGRYPTELGIGPAEYTMSQQGLVKRDIYARCSRYSHEAETGAVCPVT